VWQVVMICKRLHSKDAAEFLAQVLRQEWCDDDVGVTTVEVQEEKS
jgi:hypothetical protein